jgi:hypothetical protein
MENIHESSEKENMMPLPLEEMKYIEWKSDPSDEEGFKVVSKKRSRKRQETKEYYFQRGQRSWVSSS